MPEPLAERTGDLMRKWVAIIALSGTLLASGGWVTSCAPEGGTGNPPEPAAPKKGRNVSIEVDWPQGRTSPVTITYYAPTYLKGGCATGQRLVHRVNPPFICDWSGYTEGTISVTAMQNEKGLLICAITLGTYLNSEVSRKSTQRIGQLITCTFTDKKDA
jgi:hypothetical protein